MTITTSFASLSHAELATATGGGFMDQVMGYAKAFGSGRAVGTGPSTLMGLLDKPGKTLDTARSMLGIPDSGNPGDVYKPATMNGDGSINPGSFEAPDTGGPSVPISQ